MVTGAFSYTGAAVARELIGRGHTVHTLTNRRPPTAGGAVTSAPLRFDPEHLTRELAGADALVSTYWIRLPHSGQTFATAVDNGGLTNENKRFPRKASERGPRRAGKTESG